MILGATLIAAVTVIVVAVVWRMPAENFRLVGKRNKAFEARVVALETSLTSLQAELKVIDLERTAAKLRRR